MEIAHGIYTYRGRNGEKIRPGAGSSNVIIIKGDGLAMVDTGVTAGGAFKELVAKMDQDHLKLKDLSWILHTHCHWDHINADGDLQSKCNAKIAAGKIDAVYIENKKKNFQAFISDFNEFRKEVFPYPLVLAKFLMWLAWGHQPKLNVDEYLENNDVIDIGREIKALALPGHTKGHMGYFIPDEGVLVIGDLIDFENSQGMDINNPHSDYESALTSLEKAMTLEPSIIIPGHGEPTTGRGNVKRVLEKALNSGMEYQGLIKKALGTHPKRLKDLTYTIFPDIPFSMESMTMMLVLTVLIYMEKQDSVERVSDKAGKPAWIG